ncbi:hypothetical protein Tsubulata_034406 [Turnera subulata]|uniref:Uncharacterized protein n=1 Tax=Turnera subulata TaxID=218843 RepID=A0A9Q0F6H4_9ROSI|nr:hypothetical protein Tsubulata_034406 [Turnera subulata]
MLMYSLAFRISSDSDLLVNLYQVKIQCLTPKAKPAAGDEESTETDSHKEDVNTDSGDVEIKSEESDSTAANRAGCFSSKDLASTPYQELEAKGEEDISNHSYDLAESPTGKVPLYPSNNASSDEHSRGERVLQDSTSSPNSAPQESYFGEQEHASRSNHSSFNSRITHPENLSQEDPQEFIAKLSGSSKSLLEAAENTIEELRREAKMWERNARKVTLELDILRKEYLEQSRCQANLDVELSTTCAECDGLQKEVEQLKKLIEKPNEKPSPLEETAVQGKNAVHVIKELENDVQYQQEINANLDLQLKRSQGGNAELVSVLQELEESIEKQKAEIENFSSLHSKFNDMERSFQVIMEENRMLMNKMQELQDSKKSLQARVQALEQELEEKNETIEKTLMKEITELKSQLRELESDCQELTEENLDLLLKLKEIKNNSTEGSMPVTNSGSHVMDHESETIKLEEKMRKKLLMEADCDHNLTFRELESQKLEMEGKFQQLSAELREKTAERERLGADLLSKEDEIQNLLVHQEELKSKLSGVLKESNITSKCMKGLREESRALSSSVDSHDQILEKKSSELENGKQEMLLHLSKLKQENEELLTQKSALEAQLWQVTDERKSFELELESCSTHILSLRDDIERLRNEKEMQKVDAEQKLGKMRNQLLETQDECECTKRENSKLQSAVDKLIAEFSSLKKSNDELQRQQLELNEHCVNLESKLSESERSFANCSKRLKALEEKISLILEDSVSKETTLTSELDALVEENEVQNQRFNLLDQMYLEKLVEVENLHQKVEDLTKQLSVTRDERERMASEAIHEISGLHAAIVKLQEELNATENESEGKVKGLMEELSASRQSLEAMKTNNERISKLLLNYKSSEEKLKTNQIDLELKLTVSEYERQQVLEESTNLKTQFLKLETLQDETLALKNELNAIKSEKENLEASFAQISGQCKEMKAEKNMFIEKITSMQKAASELEDRKKYQVSLEEKVLRMEGDLMAKEALCEQYAEVNSELSRVKRSNKQLQRLIQQLQEEKTTIFTKAQSLEEKLMLREEQKNQSFSGNANSDSNQQRRGKQADKGYKTRDKNDTGGDDPARKIRVLEDKLPKAMEANSAYKAQLKIDRNCHSNRTKTDGGKGFLGSPRRASAEGEFVPKERFERTKSSLEAELKDIQERYFNMSLKYAEVEAQREELVMKLKASNDEKKWRK